MKLTSYTVNVSAIIKELIVQNELFDPLNYQLKFKLKFKLSLKYLSET